MAVYKLDETDYLQANFKPKLWRGVNVSNLLELVNDLVPSITSLTTLSENSTFEWLWGRVEIEGKGKVSVTYPYVEEHTEDFTLRNVDFSTYPYVTLVASSKNFLGWYDSCTGEMLTEQETLMLSSDNFENITGFQARFDESDLGI